MNIGKLRFINEFLKEQMNHWMLFPLALVVSGIYSHIINREDSLLLMWMLCSLFPFLFFLIRRYAFEHLLPFILLHLAAAALSLLIPVPFPAGRAICILCALGYLLYSHILRLKHGHVFSEAMQLPVAVSIAAISAFLVHNMEISDWDNYYILSLITGISLYFITYYIDNYLTFLTVNESSVAVLPAADIFHSGIGLVLAYTLLGAGLLLLGSKFTWLTEILQYGKTLLLRFIKSLFSGRTAADETKLPLVEEPIQNSMGGTIVSEPEKTFWLWGILDVVLVCLICALAVLLFVNLFRLVRRYLNLHFQQEHNAETDDTVDLREKCEIEWNAEQKLQSLFDVLSPREQIRRLYKKKLLSSAPQLSEEDKNRMNIYTAREWERKLKIRGMSDLYEQARYSDREMTMADVKKMRETCK